MAINAHAEATLTQLVQSTVLPRWRKSLGDEPRPGRGTAGRMNDGSTYRYGLRADGRYYVDLGYRINESYGDDPSSTSCWCELSSQGHVHVHRTADSFEGLATVVGVRGSYNDATPA